MSGDYHLYELPQQAFDLVVVANVLHLETRYSVPKLLKRLAAALVPGGRIVVVDIFPDEASASSQLAAKIYALNITMRNGTGAVHPLGALQQWLGEVGVFDTELFRVGERRALLGALVGVLRDRSVLVPE